LRGSEHRETNDDSRRGQTTKTMDSQQGGGNEEDHDPDDDGLLHGDELMFLLIGLNILACGFAFNYFFGNRCGLNHRRFYDPRVMLAASGTANTDNNNNAQGHDVGRLGRMSLEDRKEFVANALKTEVRD